MNIHRAWKKNTKRTPKMVYSRLPSDYQIRLEGENVTRRIYEAWDRLNNNGYPADPMKWDPVPWVIIIKGEIIELTSKERELVIDLAKAE